MLKRRMLALLSLAAGLAVSGPVAHAQIGFDDLGASVSPGSGEQVLNGYAGFDWSGFWVHNDSCSSTILAPSGYCAGVVSPKNSVYNFRGEPASILSSTGFSFGGAWFTAAWNTGLNIRIEGIRSAVSVFDESFLVNTDSPFFFSADWLDLDELRVTSSGGVDAGHGFTGAQFAMDDIYLTRTGVQVPEPATDALMMLGLAGLVVVRRRSAGSVT